MSEHTIENLVKQGSFPPPRKNKCGKRLWVWKEVEAYLAAPEDAPLDEVARIREAARRVSNG
jgi:predicted DNA-binding transcriptional regulator AlpA